MTRKQTLNKVLAFCKKRAMKSEAIMEVYDTETGTDGEWEEFQSEERILEILVQIIDMIE